MSANPPPPRLLLGSALLLWGALTDRSMAGLVLALIVEARHWTPLRWDFDERAHIRAWRLAVLLLFVTLVLLWLDDTPLMAVPRLLGWLPALLLPLQFTQTYGTRDDMSARVFSFFPSARREVADERHPVWGGRRFNFGWIYLVATLVAATPVWKMRDSAIYLPGVVLLASWALIATRRCRWRQVVVVMVLAGGLGFGGQLGLQRLVSWINDGMFRDSGLNQNPTHFRTAIGRLGKIKQSSGIIWRLRNVEGSEVPRLLRSGAYNRYNAGLWIYVPPMKEGSAVPLDEDFSPLDAVPLPDGRPFNRLRRLEVADLAGPEQSWFGLVGTVEHHAPVPLPDSATGMTGFDVQSFEANSIGTVRIFLKQAVVEGMVAWQGAGNRESDPAPEDDLALGAGERAALRQVLAELKLDELPSLEAKLARLRSYLNTFEYSRYNTIQAPRLGDGRGDTAITRFLTETRRGHCEYFATAACLLLREAKIPTRYAIGFVVTEHDKRRDEWVVRGTHAHAWTRVWDERTGLWRDFDPTPPGWEGEEFDHLAWLQVLFDFIRRANEDFNLWRNKPGNTGVVGVVLFGIGGLMLGFIVWKLWKSGSRTRTARRRGRGTASVAIVTPLHHLERAAQKHLPPRPRGRTYVDWLRGLEQVLANPEPLREAAALHQRLRFDPLGVNEPERERLAALARDLERALKTRGSGRPRPS